MHAAACCLLAVEVLLPRICMREAWHGQFDRCMYEARDGSVVVDQLSR
jgi:hypothetical protein